MYGHLTLFKTPTAAAVSPHSHHRDMSQNKVHSVGKVPFSWENAPGVSKVSPKECLGDVGEETRKLPPPPCPSDSSPRVVAHYLHVPLPPCPFQPPLRSSSKKGINREDPFLAAYMECTKSVRHGVSSKIKHKVGIGSTLRMRVLGLISCKNSCGAREDSLVRLAPLPDAADEDFRR